MKIEKIFIFILILILCSILPNYVFPQSTSQNYNNKKSVNSESGGRTTSSNYKSIYSMGQPSAVGNSQSSNFKIYTGFIYKFVEPSKILNYKVTIYWWDDTSNRWLGDEIGEYRPLKNAKVELYDDDWPSGPGIGDEKLGERILDENGSITFFNIQSNEADGPDLYVKIILECNEVKFLDYGLADLYSGVDENVTKSLDATCQMNKKEQSTYSFVYNTIQELHSKWKNFTGYSIPQVTVQIRPAWIPWDLTNYTELRLPFTYIALGYNNDPLKSSANNKFDIAHEYGHHIMYKIYGDKFPQGAKSRSSHFVTTESDIIFAFIEGWAEFVQNMMYLDWETSRNNTWLHECVVPDEYGFLHTESDIETNKWWMGYDIEQENDKYINPNDNWGGIVEGAIASIFWDIYDDENSDEPKGGIQNGLDKIYNTLTSIPHPGDIMEFFSNFISLFPDDKAKLKDIYISHGVILDEILKFTSYCPVDLLVIDPNGHKIDKLINEISWANYSEIDRNGDNSLDDRILIIKPIKGNYKVYVIPEQDTNQNDTFTLTVEEDENIITLVDNVKISNITNTPYNYQSNGVTNVKNKLIDNMPIRNYLYKNYPNPFNPSTVIVYQIASYSKVEISIYNILGVKINSLVYEMKSPGVYNLIWNGKDNFDNNVPSGLYIIRMITDGDYFTNKIIFTK